ncbi:winged helix-turn-helix domain-containing protein [Paenarthrobacter nitroguajacolicus]|uniref:winged helix-turn-helix domain-containing protein n=1 Tax=Paenarthrobacter nitroguajacolicus TaxID=211146 RepID=UPI000B0C6CB7|nr:MarR family transcriptional regulator [Paenarthrobacter nitroguajacolicus]
MLATDVVLLRELEEQVAARGASTLSIRQMAERTGVTHKTVNRSLGRLAAAGWIVKGRQSYGNRPTVWRLSHQAVPADQAKLSERMTPRDGGGMPDLFRRRDLSGPGALYRELPDQGLFATKDALIRTSRTANIRTVEWWLLVLASQLWPLVEEVVPTDGTILWRKLHISDEQFTANAEHLQRHAEVSGRRHLKTKARMQRQHQRERLVMTFRSVVPRGN